MAQTNSNTGAVDQESVHTCVLNAFAGGHFFGFAFFSADFFALLMSARAAW